MTSHSRKACPGIVEEELEAAGASYRLVINKHYKFYILHEGREHPYFCGGTTGSGNRAQANTRAGIRRLLKQLGLLVKSAERG